MNVNEKELGNALQGIAEHLIAIDNLVSRIGIGLTAVKAVLAIQMNPSHPKEALSKIEQIESELARLDPNAPARQKVADALEIIKILEKHGGPKQA